MTISIKSDRLLVEMFSPEDGLITTRFDRAAHIFNIVLDGKHRFCVPEQRLPDRVTSFGNGLCSEFVWPELALEAKAGEQFAKLGVGLLTQTQDNKPFGFFDKYETLLPDLDISGREDRVVFTLDMPLCQGVGARVYRKVVVQENNLFIHTTLENTGSRTLDLSEYNHNFVAIDDIPVGPGYHFYMPFDKSLASVAGLGATIGAREPAPGLLVNDKPNYVSWSRVCDGLTWFKRAEEADIKPMAGYHWRLSHDNSPAWIRESQSFAPHAFAFWGVEHCVCPEIFMKINVPPGQKQAWTRIWTFGCREGDS